MTYPQAIKYLESFINYEKIPAYPYKNSLRLERVNNFLKAINNPQDSLRCIHIAGSKGKGSTCVFSAYILKEAGFKVGLYTSPHLSDFRERIRVLQGPGEEGGGRKQDFEGMISQNELTGLVEGLKPAIERYNKNSKYGPLTFFEVYTALAFIYFKEKKVDFAVIETGLGGRLDATNTVSPLVCAITPISYEHADKLGPTLKQIACEKAGIIKSVTGRVSIVVSAPQDKEAKEIIRGRCKEVKARLYEVGRDILYEQARDGFNVSGVFGEYAHLEIQLLGAHQIVNASVAIGISEMLRFYGIIIGSENIRDGLRNAFWPARCEVITQDPYLILDGAQNAASAKALKETIKENFRYKRLILILGICNDKDIKGIFSQLGGIADTVIFTKADNPRAMEPEILARYFKAKEVFITHNAKKAMAKASKIAKKEDLILAAGSLFVAAQIRGIIKNA
jgi:dihydrofolate synthase/folylpolyglutamate synthase